MNAGGATALVDYTNEAQGNSRLPGVMALGFIAAFHETLAMSVIVSNGVAALKNVLVTETEDHIRVKLFLFNIFFPFYPTFKKEREIPSHHAFLLLLFYFLFYFIFYFLFYFCHFVGGVRVLLHGLLDKLEDTVLNMLEQLQRQMFCDDF